VARLNKLLERIKYGRCDEFFYSHALPHGHVANFIPDNHDSVLHEHLPKDHALIGLDDAMLPGLGYDSFVKLLFEFIKALLIELVYYPLRAVLDSVDSLHLVDQIL